MKNPLSPGKTQTVIIGIVLLFIIIVSLIWHSNGQSSQILAEALQTTISSTALTGTTPAPTVQHEPDVTFGIVLAGILLVVVILFGTVYGTRIVKKPPQES